MSKKRMLVVGLLVLTLLLPSCAPKVVKETVVVEKAVEKVVKETVVVEKAVEKTVKETVVVTEEKVVTATPEPPKEAVKIGVYTVAWSVATMDMMAQLIDMFNEEHKGWIEAEYIQGDWGEGDNYVAAGVAAGGGIADVVEWWTGGVQGWYEHDLVYDLSPYITPKIRATMPEMQWAARSTDDGAVFMSGTAGGPNSSLYYNPALLEAAGVPTPDAKRPWTWAQFDQYTKMLTVDGSGNNLYDNPDAFDQDDVVQWGFLPRLDIEKLWEEGNNFALQASGNYMIRKDDAGKWDIFFDEDAVLALRTFYGVIAEGVAPEESIGLTGESQDELFVQGQGALVLRGFFNVMVLRERYPDFEFGVMPIPQPEGGKHYWTTVGQGFGVPKCSEHPAEAAEFVFWFQQPQPQALWANALYIPPVNPAALTDPELVANPDWDLMRYYYFIGEAVDLDFCTNEQEFTTTVFSPTMMEVVQGTKTLEQAIAEIKAAAPDVLNQ